MEQKNVRALSLIVCTFTYLIIGAAIFDVLESENDTRQRARLARLRSETFGKYNLSAEHERQFEQAVLLGVPHAAGYQWRFAGAFYFSLCVITTVGYGHSTPFTTFGKAFCIVYALAGIPLNLVMFQSIGERLNTFISHVIIKIPAQLRLAVLGAVGVRRPVSPMQLILVSSSIGMLITLTGVFVFHRVEGWSLFESYYYCFITLSTIGFGDYVPLQQRNSLQERPYYVVFTLLFILFGLAVFSACVNLLVIRFMASNTETPGGKQERSSIVFESLSDDNAETGTSDADGREGREGRRRTVFMSGGKQQPPANGSGPMSGQHPTSVKDAVRAAAAVTPPRVSSVHKLSVAATYANSQVIVLGRPEETVETQQQTGRRRSSSTAPCFTSCIPNSSSQLSADPQSTASDEIRPSLMCPMCGKPRRVVSTCASSSDVSTGAHNGALGVLVSNCNTSAVRRHKQRRRPFTVRPRPVARVTHLIQPTGSGRNDPDSIVIRHLKATVNTHIG